MNTQFIVIAGGSYSGALVLYYLQNYLSRSRNPYDLLFISERSFYFFHDLLSEFLCNTCLFGEISQSFRSMGLLRPGVSYLETKILNIDLKEKLIHTLKGSVKYDYLILSPDCDKHKNNAGFDTDNLYEFKSPEDVLNLKKHLLSCLEKAAGEKELDIKKSLLSFTIIGAKKQGVEIACALCDYLNNLLKNNFPELKKSLLSIYLIEKKKATDFKVSPFYNDAIYYDLNKKSINVLMDSTITNIYKDKVHVNNTREILCSTVIHSGKNLSSSLIQMLPLEKNGLQQACVDLYLRAPGYENVFITGENASCIDLNENAEKMAFFYKEQARICARNVFNKISNNPLKPLKPSADAGYHLLGKHNAVVKIKNLCFNGFIGWFIFRLIYIASFIGMRKKIKRLALLLISLSGLKDDELLNVNMFSLQTNKELIKK